MSRAGAGDRAPEASYAGPPPILGDPNPGALRAALHFGYDLLWILAMVVASPWWIGRSLIDRRFRVMVFERLGVGLPRLARAGPGGRVLVHGVSVGEVKAAQSLVRSLRELDPPCEVVISTTTDTGATVARGLYGEVPVVRFPVDLSWVVSRFLRRLRPSCVVLVELEIWPNFLRAANFARVPVAVVNGRITEESFKSYRLFRHALPQFNRLSLFCAQNERYARFFGDLVGSMERIVVTGNLKFDGLGADLPPEDPELARWVRGRPGQLVFVGGSTHDPEELELARVTRERLPDGRVVLVPRHPVRAREILRRLAGQGVQAQLLTELRAGLEELDLRRPLLVDTIGELERIYALSDLVFVGGSLVPHGGQNVLEPAALGVPVLHGPHVANFAQEAALLAEAGASRQVADARELGLALEHLAGDLAERERMARAGRGAVISQRGATDLTLSALARRCLGTA
jgi:3-deoxy-D-manno-octulosonic-acid transferase